MGRYILLVSIPAWKKTWNKYTQNDGAIFTVPYSRVDLDGDFMKKRLAGSYTIEVYAERLAGRPFSWSGYKFIIEEKRTALMGRSVSASGKGGTWSLLIRQNEYDPENFLRMCSLLNQEE